jgi:hypothetical protein
MKHKLACRLAVTYGFLFILAIAVVDIALVSVYRASQLKKNEDYYINLSSILSSMAENNIRITNYITHGEGLADRRNGRVIQYKSYLHLYKFPRREPVRSFVI